MVCCAELLAGEKGASMNFKDFLKTTREAKGKSLYWIHQQTEIDLTMLRRYEHGLSQPTIPKAEAICRALGATYTIGKER